MNILPYNHVVDVNWTNTHRLSLKLLMKTAYLFVSAPSWARTTVADGHKFSTIRHLSWRLIDRSGRKRNFYLLHVHLSTSLGLLQSEFRTYDPVADLGIDGRGAPPEVWPSPHRGSWLGAVPPAGVQGEGEALQKLKHKNTLEASQKALLRCKRHVHR